MFVSLSMALTVGCKSSSTRSPAAAASADTPVITSISPDSGPAGTAYPIEITIEGRGFLDSTNVVTFGTVTIADVRSSQARTRIVVNLPKQTPASGEVPPSPLLPGRYEIRVRTPAGVSNAINFNLTREPQ